VKNYGSNFALKMETARITETSILYPQSKTWLTLIIHHVVELQSSNLRTKSPANKLPTMSSHSICANTAVVQLTLVPNRENTNWTNLPFTQELIQAFECNRLAS
jgi:hypothetical protein